MPLYIIIHYNKLLKFTAVSYLGVQVGWLRDLIGPSGGSVWQYLHYAGILDPVDASAEPALRLKCLVLVSVCLKQRSLRRATAMPVSCMYFSCRFIEVEATVEMCAFSLRMVVAYQVLSQWA